LFFILPPPSILCFWFEVKATLKIKIKKKEIDLEILNGNSLMLF